MRLARLAWSSAPLLVVATSVACTVACNGSSSATPAAGTCSFVAPIPVLPATPLTPSDLEYGNLPPGISVQSYAEAQGLAYLDSFVGSYLRGGVPLYTGTLAAHDNESVLGLDCSGGSTACKDQSITEGPAIASLAVGDGGASLSVHSLAQHEYVVFQQSQGVADVTTVGLVLPDDSSGGNTGTCKGCVPSFGSMPKSITFENIESSAEVAVNATPFGTDAGAVDAAGALLHTYASASLTVAEPCALTFNDLIELNTLNPISTPYGFATPTFVLTGGQMVAELQGSVYAEGSEGTGNYCSTWYMIELYVDPSNLADYGVRSYQTFTPDAGYDDYNVCAGG
jgi:hypothetical protein